MYSWALAGDSFTVPGPLLTKKSPAGVAVGTEILVEEEVLDRLAEGPVVGDAGERLYMASAKERS